MLAVLGALLAVIAAGASAATQQARGMTRSAAPLPTLGCLRLGAGYLIKVRPVTCDIESAASYKQRGTDPYSYQEAPLVHMKWSSWTRTNAHGRGRLAAGMNGFPKVSVTLSAPRAGCPPSTSTPNYEHARTFTRLTLHIGMRTVLTRLPREACFSPGE